MKGKSFNWEYWSYNILAVATPGKGAHVALPLQLDIFPGTTHQFLCHSLIGYRELELIGTQGSSRAWGRLKPTLNHLSLIGFEDETLTLELVDIACINASAVDKEKMEIDKKPQGHNDNWYEGGDDFSFAW